MAKKTKSSTAKPKSAKRSRSVSVYSNLSRKRRTKKDRASRTKAEYLASLPKHPVKRFMYRMHPKRVAKFWFSRHGAMVAVKLAGIGILLMVLLVGAVFAYYRKDIDEIRPGKIAERVQTTVTTYTDRNGEILWKDKGGGNYWLAVDSKDISDSMKAATIAIEDKGFYEHNGVSFSGITRSLFVNAQRQNVQGGSTLTQQLVKQVFLADEAHKRGVDGIPRKIKEVILAVEVERMYNKDQILNLYLNESPYGGPRNGVESAAQTYFKKHASQLSLAESALLAAIPNSPGKYDPYTGDNAALVARQHQVLDAMVDTKAISRKEADTAKKIPIIDKIRPLSDQLDNTKAPHFVLMVKQQLERDLGKAIVGRGGLTVKTTLDWRIQKKLEQATADMFKSMWPSYYSFTNSASTLEDVKTGQIIAMQGSRDFNYPGFGQDNAATAMIQPGSTIKPLVYAKLFENKGSNAQNFGSGSILADDHGADGIYGAKLQNWDGGYKGAINVRKALALSRNVPAVKAMYVSGVQPTIEYIRDMGDTSYCTVGPEATVGLAAAIGGCGTRQVDHVNAIASIARLGVYKPYSTVLEVKNNKGDVLQRYKATSKKVGSPEASYIVSDILSDKNMRYGLFGGSSYRLEVPGVINAAKTGTTDIDGQAKDIWTVSYSSTLAMATWLGNSDTRVLTGATSNSSLPGDIIRPVMEYAHKEIYAREGKWKSGDWLKRPSGIQQLGGELFPSYYNKSQARSNAKLTFDKVSKKIATDCTPPGARIEISVTGIKDPVTKKKTYFASDGYITTEKDDVHKCSDAKPSLTVSPSANGKRIIINYSAGKFKLRNVTVNAGGTQVANLSVSGSGSKVVSSGQTGNKKYAISGRVVDDGFYDSSAASSYTP